MKRMMRWIFHAACAVSLLLCLGSAGMWVRWHWISDCWVRFDGKAEWVVTTGRGIALIRVDFTPNTFLVVAAPTAWGHTTFSGFDSTLELYSPDSSTTTFPVIRVDRRWKAPGVVFEQTHSDLASVGVFYLSYAWIVPLTAVMPAWWVYWFFKIRRRFGAGMCQKCGYDLRASKERCPECGTAVAGK